MGIFKYEDDLLKHYVRTQAWLPLCRDRLRLVRAKARRTSQARRLRYFTFCAIGAIDVLMLDVAKVIRRSNNKEFDTVVFFDRGNIEIIETQKRIPGARGYPGEFVEIVLMPDPEEEVLVEGSEPLAAPPDQPDLASTRDRQRRLDLRHKFIQEFPFDIVNLDLEGYFFTPRDPFPGKLIRAMRKILLWQQSPLDRSNPASERLDGFSLMFTTKIGPSNLTDEYLQMLRQAIQRNLDRDAALAAILQQRAEKSDVELLQGENFEVFFRIALPKLILAILLEADWYVDPEKGISIFEIERHSQDGPYKMLHVVLDVRRQEPPQDLRAPGDGPIDDAVTAYGKTAREIFENPEIQVTNEILDEESLRASLERIYARRRKYYPEVEEA